MAEKKRGRISRRDFVKAAGVGALAAGLGPGIIIPGRARAARKTLKILNWVHFVPPYDEWFNKKYIKEWGEKREARLHPRPVGP